MTGPRRAILGALAAVAAIAYGWLDPRHRAGLDPEAESAWRETLSKVEAPSVARHHTDATVYLAAALALDRGTDPYAAASPRGWKYVYPPLFAALLRPIARWPVADAAFALYMLNALALAASAVLLARAIGPPRGALAVGVALLVAAPFLVQTLQRCQVTILLLATQVGALALLLRGRDALAGVVLALGVALRLTPALVAGMVGVACLRRLLRPGERLAALTFPAGLAIGLVLWFAAVPSLLLGADRAREATGTWIESSRRLYAAAPADRADLVAEYGIDEASFKNQGVGRVTSDGIATGVALLVVLGAAVLGGWGLLDRSTPLFRRVFALGVFLPVLVTRYAWPVHYVVAVPFLAEAVAARRALAVGVFALGVALFYAGHSQALRFLPQFGVLVVAAAAAAALSLRGIGEPAGAPPPSDGAILGRYTDRHPVRRLYRSSRLAFGGYEDLLPLFPSHGTVVDLGAGEGLLAHALVARSPGLRVVALDHDEGRLARLRSSASGLPIEASRGRIEDAAIPRCEGVALVDVLHYLPRDAQAALLARAAAALEPGGVLVMRDPDAGAGARFLWNRLHERVATALGLTRARIGEYRASSEWEALLRETGFSGVRVLPLRAGSPYADRTIVAEKPR